MSAKSIIWLQEQMLSDPEVKYYAAGRALGDSIEAHNGHLRFYQKNPSPTQVKRFSKIISVSHFLTRVMGSNVPPDESVFLTEFENLKIRRPKKKRTQNVTVTVPEKFTNSSTI